MEKENSGLIKRLSDRVNGIREELFEQQVYTAGMENCIYGKLELAYKNFKVDNFRKGIVVNKVDFFYDKIKELEEICLLIQPKQSESLEDRGKEIVYHDILFNITSIIELIKTKIEVESRSNYKSKRNVNTDKKNTYNFLLKHQKINELYKALKELGIISQSNKYKDFEYIFSNSPISGIKNPIIWGSNNASELIFFIMELIDAEVLSGKGKNMDYKKMIVCFLTNKNENFQANFKQIKNNIDFTLNKDRQSQIKDIIQNLIK